MSKTKILQVAKIFFSALVFSFVFSKPAHAQTLPWAVPCVSPVLPKPFSQPFTDVATLSGLECVVYNVLAIALGLAAVVLFIMLVIGGFKYITAGGDPKAVDAAQKTLTHAIAGLVVLILAYLILLWIGLITGVDVTLFRIYKP